MTELRPGEATPAKADEDKWTGKAIGGGVAAVLGGIIGYLLLGPAGILPAAVVIGLLGVALGSVFD